MVQLRTHNVALALYGVLLILPTAVLGGLQWYEIKYQYENQRARVPSEADDAARRLQEMIAGEFNRLMRTETDRPFLQYAQQQMQIDADSKRRELVPSPLDNLHGHARPRGILTWFVFDRMEGPQARIYYLVGESEWAFASDFDIDPAMRRFMVRELEDSPLVPEETVSRAPGDLQHVPLAALGIFLARERIPECTERALHVWSDTLVPLKVTPLELYFEVSEQGPLLFARRRVIVTGSPEYQEDGDPCLETLARGVDLVQGFLIDPRWLLDEVPARVALSVLNQNQRFLPRSDAQGSPEGLEYRAGIRLIEHLNIETSRPEDGDYGEVKIAVDLEHLESGYHSQAWRFFGMAAMLVLSLATGLMLLMRSVSQDLERARRTENFVAAVTHELRTPLTAIRLHGEMLLDGWVKEETQREYYRRIVRETERLSTLVERVLQKGRLKAGAVKPEPMNLNDAVEALREPLEHASTQNDLAFHLEPGLPPTYLTVEALNTILVNLVENARKYAPVDPQDPSAEPIRIGTRLRRGKVVMEVSDRGPGIPPEERELVFEAFYRVGNEALRSSKGAGLGLHLVALQSEAIGASVAILDRSGGGCTFRITFRSATPSA